MPEDSEKTALSAGVQPNDTPYRGQHAVVTGGGRGIGAVVAEYLAVRGAAVTLMGRSVETLKQQRDRMAEASGATVGVQSVDVTDADKVATAFAAAADEFGPATILINNAGQAASAPFKRTDAALMQRMIDINLMGVFHCTQAALPAMIDGGYGRVVTVASTAGLVGYRYVSAYVASKHAVIGMTKSLALELADKGITVNAVCPSYVDTDMTQDTVKNIVEKTGCTPEEAVQQIVASNPQKRLIDPEEVASAVGWLALPGSHSITGQALAVAGGEVM